MKTDLKIGKYYRVDPESGECTGLKSNRYCVCLCLSKAKGKFNSQGDFVKTYNLLWIRDCTRHKSSNRIDWNISSYDNDYIELDI